MPLTHQRNDNNVVEAPLRAGLRPVREDGTTTEVFRPHRTMHPPVEKEPEPGEPEKHKPDPAMLADKKVMKAQAAVETLRQANASDQMIARAMGRVREAELDYTERQAVRLNTQRQKGLEDLKAKQHERIAREHIQRLSGFAQVAIKIGRVCVTIKTDRNMESTARIFALTDATRALHVATRESEKLVSAALQGRDPGEQDTAYLIRSLTYELRRSIATGDTVISEI